MDENVIYISDETGREVKMRIFFNFDYNDKKYVLVYEDGQEDPEELLPFAYDDEGHLYYVEDEEELAIIYEVLDSFEGEGEEDSEEE